MRAYLDICITPSFVSTCSVLLRVGTGKSIVILGALTQREGKLVVHDAVPQKNLKLFPIASKRTVHPNGKPEIGRR